MTADSMDRPALADLWPAALAGALGMGCFMGFGRFSFTPILPGMMSSLHLTASDAGWIAAANFAGYLGGALLSSGRWAAGRERMVAIAALLATALLLAAMALGSSLPVFMVIRFLAGIASAIGLVFASALVLSAARGNTTVQAAHFGGVGIGIALSAIVSTLTRATVTEDAAAWRVEWLLGGAIVLAAAPVIIRLLPRHGPASASSIPASEPPLRPTGAMVRLCISYLLFGFGYVVAATFLVAMARAGAAGREVEFLCWLITGFAGAASLFLWQPVLGRLGLHASYRVSLTAEALGSAAMVLLPGRAAPLAGGLLFGITFLVVTAYALQIGRRIFPQSPRRVIAVMTAVFGLGQIAGPVAAGMLVDATGAYLAAGLLAAAALAAGAAVSPGR